MGRKYQLEASRRSRSKWAPGPPPAPRVQLERLGPQRQANTSVAHLAKLTASDAIGVGNGFGRPVAISGDTIIAGAMWDDHSGEIDAGSS